MNQIMDLIYIYYQVYDLINVENGDRMENKRPIKMPNMQTRRPTISQKQRVVFTN
jgi:hypothetical protein